MHDQHFQIGPLDLNLRLRSAQKAAVSFVSSEKLLGMSKLKNPALTSINKSSDYAEVYNKTLWLRTVPLS